MKPLQISMLVKGLGCYADLYSFEPSVVLKKKSKKSSGNLYLKKKNSLDNSRNYISAKDITVKDLEKMYKNSKQLATGRQLHAMAIRGAQFFWKVIVCMEHKWDSKTGTPKGTGMSIDNVIYYVRTQMYKNYSKKKENKDYAETDVKSSLKCRFN